MFGRLFLECPVYYRDNYIIVIVIFLIVKYQFKRFGAKTKQILYIEIFVFVYLKWILQIIAANSLLDWSFYFLFMMLFTNLLSFKLKSKKNLKKSFY